MAISSRIVGSQRKIVMLCNSARTVSNVMAWHEAGKVDEWSVGQGRELLLSGRVVAVFRRPNAFMQSMACVLIKAALSPGRIGWHMRNLPMHGWQYNIADGVNCDSKADARLLRSRSARRFNLDRRITCDYSAASNAQQL